MTTDPTCLTGELVTVVKEVARVDSRMLASSLETLHKNTFAQIKAYQTDFEAFGKLGAQQIVDAPVAKAATHVCDLHDLLVRLNGGLIGLRWMAVAVAGEPHKTARAAFGQMVLADHDPNRLAPGLWG